MAENAALAAPAATVTLAGTETLELLLARATPNPPVSAAPLNEAVQAEVPPPLTVVGVHESPLSVGWAGWTIVRVPPVPEAEIEVLPVTSETNTPVTRIGDEVSKEPGEIVNVTSATVPSRITFSFVPQVTQVVAVLPVEQLMLFAAAVAVDPTATLTIEMSEDE